MNFFLILLSFGLLFSQFPKGYQLNTTNLGRFEMISKDGLSSNAIMSIRSFDEQLFFLGTGAGLGHAEISSQSNIIFKHFIYSGLPEGGNPALSIGHGIIAVSGVIDTSVFNGSEPKGTGISFSKNSGEDWLFFSQPVDPIPHSSANGYQTISWGGQQVSALAVTTDIDNVTYDIAIGERYIYIANWAGGIRRYFHLPSSDETRTWEIIPLPQDNELELECGNIDIEKYEVNPKDPADGGNHNHKGFGVYVIEDTLWAGTAAGINKGIINGECINWTNHFQTGLDNISGNWVIGFIHQDFVEFTRIWAITWATQHPETHGLSYTDNGGKSWEITNPLGNKSGKVYDLHAQGDSIWASTEIGLYISIDGDHWEKYNNITDSITGEKILTGSVFSSYYSSLFETLWIGTGDGLAHINEIETITRFWESPDPFSVYPNPFLINNHNQLDNNGYVRFIYTNPNNYKAKIDIFDFSMDKVIALNNSNFINSESESEIIWNGHNEYGNKVSNGVYFCRLTINKKYYWTKLAVIN